jgi:hypothetical protein
MTINDKYIDNSIQVLFVHRPYITTRCIQSDFEDCADILT